MCSRQWGLLSPRRSGFVLRGNNNKRRTLRSLVSWLTRRIMTLFARSPSALSPGSWRKAPKPASRWSLYRSPKRFPQTVLSKTPNNLQTNSKKISSYKTLSSTSTPFPYPTNWWGPKTSNSSNRISKTSSRSKTKTTNFNHTPPQPPFRADRPKRSRPEKRTFWTFLTSCCRLITWISLTRCIISSLFIMKRIKVCWFSETGSIGISSRWSWFSTRLLKKS